MLSVGHTAPPPTINDSGRKVRIGMVLDQSFPPDARVEREATALAEAGYEVHLLCALRAQDTLSNQAYRGFYIHRVSPAKVLWRLPFGLTTRLPYQSLIRNFFHHFRNIDTQWYTLIDDFIKQYGIDVLHVHDLRLVGTALAVADRLEVPVIADLHENYPALMEMMKGRGNPKKGAYQRERWEKIETESIDGALQIITVTDEARERLIRKGIYPGKIMVLENTVDIEKFHAASVDNTVIRRYKPDFLLTYVGHLNDTHRGIQTVLEAMGILKHEIPELKFVGAGSLREPYRELLASIIDKHGLQNRVEFTGWLDESDFVTYIEASDICVCPHIVNDHTEATFPNKVYLYHLFKKPILATNAVPLQRYIDESGGGMTFDSGNAQQLAEHIRFLYARPDVRREMASKGNRLVLEKYNWAKSSQDLVTMYDFLIDEMTESFDEGYTE